MRNALFTTFVALGFGVCTPVFAQDAPHPVAAEPEIDKPTVVIRDGDLSLTCAQLGEATAQLSQTMGGAPSEGLIEAVGGVARTGAAALIPGAGLVIAGVDALAKPGRDRRDAETLAVEHRWYYLNGLYAGRDCREQAEAARQVTAPALPTAATRVGASPIAPPMESVPPPVAASGRIRSATDD